MKPVISTKIEKQNSVHTLVRVWNRGALAGTLVVNTADAAEIIGRLEGAPVNIRKVVVEKSSATAAGAVTGAGGESEGDDRDGERSILAGIQLLLARRPRLHSRTGYNRLG